MKAKATKPPVNFSPFKLEILVESREEAEKLYALFNHEKLREALKLTGETTKSIRKAIIDGAGDVNYTK